MIPIVTVLGALVCSAAPQLQSTPRADLPWSVAVWAVADGQGAPACEDPDLAALRAHGATCSREDVSGGALLTVGAPPELEAEVERALLRRSGGVLFMEGRSRGPSAAVARGPSPRAARAVPDGPAIVLPLAPGASLFGVEGEALLRLVARAAPEPAPTLLLQRGGASLVWSYASPPAAAAALPALKDALRRLADKPSAAAAARALRLEAESAVAARHAAVGALSRDGARAWLATGHSVLDVEGDLDARLRSRLIVEALALTGASAAPTAPAR